MRTLFRNVTVNDVMCDVRLGPELVEEVAPTLPTSGADEVVDGHGAALLPGLHDHHLHLLASAAARLSVDCGEGLEALAGAPSSAWIRGVNASESVDRWVLDHFVPDRPVRVQHRSGGLWMLNSRALEAVEHVLAGPDVERDHDGQPTGRLWRFDERLRAALPQAERERAAALHDFVHELHGYGVTSVTDATPNLDPFAVARLNEINLHVTLLGDPDGGAPWKIHLRDHDLPSLAELTNWIGDQHEQNRPVAVHCVSRESLILTLAALDDAGRLPGDRVEHAGVVPEEMRAHLADLVVVTQPAMLVARSAQYLTEVAADDVGCLYPLASLIEAGIQTWLSSDAPYGPADPWTILRAARDRDLVPEERLPVDRAVLSLWADASGTPRSVAPGQPGRVCLLDVGWSEMSSNPDAQAVRLVRGPGIRHGE